MEIQYNNNIKERFIPISYQELLDNTLDYLDIKDDKYREFGEKLHIYYYRKFYNRLQRIKYHYSIFNPDNDNISINQKTENIYNNFEKELLSEVSTLINSANYERLTLEMLNNSINRKSPYGVEVSVDFDDFDTIELYVRGESIQTDEIRDPKTLYIKKKIIQEPIYRRIFIIIKPKDDNHRIYIKLFKDIPQIDLEMLFPNTKVRMTLFDKLKITLFGGGGTVGGGSTLIAKLGVATIDPISALMAVGAFGAILWRQIKEVIFKKTHYMAKLAQNLYFHNLDNNEGALNYLIELSQEEESKEALLVYLFLAKENKFITANQIDKNIELYIKKLYNIDMDFEISDGIKKVLDLGVVIERDSKFGVVDINQSLKILNIEEREDYV
jgi:hypothetical protein